MNLAACKFSKPSTGNDVHTAHVHHVWPSALSLTLFSGPKV